MKKKKSGKPANSVIDDLKRLRELDAFAIQLVESNIDVLSERIAKRIGNINKGESAKPKGRTKRHNSDS